MELEVVERLQNLVAELGVRDTGLGVEARSDGILLEHRADTEVLTEFTKEVDRGDLGRPVEVVHHASGRRTLEVEVALNLAPQTLDPLGDGVTRVEGALRGRTRVTNETGGSADKTKRLVAGQLQATKQQQLDEVSEVQRRRRRVEAAIVGDRLASEQSAQFLTVSGHVHITTPLELVKNVFERCVVRLACEIEFGHALHRTKPARTPCSPRQQRCWGRAPKCTTPTRCSLD